MFDINKSINKMLGKKVIGKDMLSKNMSKKITADDVGLNDNDVLGWTKTGALVAVLSVNMYRSNAYFVYGKPNSTGKMISFDTAKNSIVEFTNFGRKWFSQHKN